MVIDQYYLNLFRLWTQKEQYHEWFFLDECRVLNWVIDSVLKATKVEETFKQKLVNIICQLVLESTKAAEHEKLGGALTDQVGVTTAVPVPLCDTFLLNFHFGEIETNTRK